VLGVDSRGLSLQQATGTAGGLPNANAVFKTSSGTLTISGGQIGALVGVQKRINDGIDHVDTLAKSLIFELNKLHASGQGLQGFGSVTSTSVVADPTAALNTAASGLKFVPNNGSFVVHVKQKDTGLVTSTLVQVDLDGRGGDDTTLNSLRASLAGISGVNATITGGKLTISSANANAEISFSQDSSGTLAALGVNTFYTGRDARDIAVSKTLMDSPSLLAAAKNGESGDNQTARAIAALEGTPVGSLNGASLKDSYQALVNGVAAASSTAKDNAEAAKSIADTLDAQRQALSGVSLDEEAVNLMKQQRAFQAAARLISTVDELTKTLLAMMT
jgi:flagellar hook-associated protein 1 FlgK